MDDEELSNIVKILREHQEILETQSEIIELLLKSVYQLYENTERPNRDLQKWHERIFPDVNKNNLK